MAQKKDGFDRPLLVEIPGALHKALGLEVLLSGETRRQIVMEALQRELKRREKKRQRQSAQGDE